MRLLLVEDDKNLGKATAEGLKESHALDWVRSAEEAEEALCDFRDLCTKLERENNQLRAALKFYADPQSYGRGGGSIQRVIVDSGAIARGALNGAWLAQPEISA
jgi:hypothetical protein